ncbi:hypothetical protein TBLA_0F03350 [Henningerozyma blattae CBS 6284]|uniref:Mitochondrial intermembrane space import and assembly protein 40 n=1 Tax=Henningerozyma blattae (strain ATCC 34711 / CBS 6284 / DSM 70876 / NBRC 10599 / NRRL Y-10934 / UCD 77-7) TaxID=1071380 RepID=I2H670_HENB6|nr:hypothetical protein TBLA_0F03350 [Tetrapisispora blattae CBS 6284]CCH61872.1 hypothetical protein TBLA_0F03350 [Tetrapisispora blattae CBS 6284]
MFLNQTRVCSRKCLKSLAMNSKSFSLQKTAPILNTQLIRSYSATSPRFNSHNNSNKTGQDQLDNSSQLPGMILGAVVSLSAIYFILPKNKNDKTITNKQEISITPTIVPDELEKDIEVEVIDSASTILEDTAETVTGSISSSNNIEELKDTLEPKDEQLNGETKPEGAYNPDTGEINWDCPCLGGMADGPCGEEFKAAFSCFVYSDAEPKGIDCVEKFQHMQDCFRKYPEHYSDVLEQEKSEEEIDNILSMEEASKTNAALTSEGTSENSTSELVEAIKNKVEENKASTFASLETQEENSVLDIEDSLSTEPATNSNDSDTK